MQQSAAACYISSVESESKEQHETNNKITYFLERLSCHPDEYVRCGENVQSSKKKKKRLSKSNVCSINHCAVNEAGNKQGGAESIRSSGKEEKKEDEGKTNMGRCNMSFHNTFPLSHYSSEINEQHAMLIDEELDNPQYDHIFIKANTTTNSIPSETSTS